MPQEKWNLETTLFFLSFLPSHRNVLQTLLKFFQSQAGYQYSNRLFRGAINKDIFLYNTNTQQI